MKRSLLLIALLALTLSACRMSGAGNTAPATTGKLTAEEAEAAALAHAGLSREQVRFSRTEYEIDDGRPEYEIEFRADNTEYDYTIHAETGDVLDWDKERDGPTSAQPSATRPATTEPAATKLTATEAEAIALEHAGLSREQVRFSRTEYEIDDGRPEYEIKFRADNTEYDYTIHAETGKVLDWGKERDDDAPVSAQPTITEPTPTKPAATKLTAAEAEAAALAHAGLSREQVRFSRTEYEVDDGRPEYEIEFRADNTEYDYTIHAGTGKVLDWSKERDDDAPASAVTEPSSTKLTPEEAEAIALANAGLTADQVSRLRTEYEVDDGVPQYEVQFYYEGLEYDYEIHAETGEVLSRDRDD